MLLFLEHVCVNALFWLLVFVEAVISTSCLCCLVYSDNAMLVMLLYNTKSITVCVRYFIRCTYHIRAQTCFEAVSVYPPPWLPINSKSAHISNE